MKVILHKQIHGSVAAASSSDALLCRTIDLPFVPFKGLYILAEDDFEATITHVSYNLEEEVFHCYTPDDKEIYQAKLHRREHRSIREIMKDWLENGWELEREPYHYED